MFRGKRINWESEPKIKIGILNMESWKGSQRVHELHEITSEITICMCKHIFSGYKDHIFHYILKGKELFH